jgi:deazaflavin-dependent oxidoreductase (nitroreductase family)
MWFNPFMIWLIRSPLHQLLSKNFMILSYTGHKSGKSYQVPVNYTRQGDDLVTFSYRERTWWRNLRGGASVMLRLEGKDVSATSRVTEDVPEVVEALTTYLSQTPQMARYFQVSLDSSGVPSTEDIKKTAAERVVILTHIDRR